jgi:HEAT repeat protein
LEWLIANLADKDITNTPYGSDHPALYLGLIGNPLAVEPLVAALRSEKSGYRREWIIEALGRIASVDAVGALIAALESYVDETRSILRALGNSIDARAVKHLLRLLDTSNRSRSALKALEFVLARNASDLQDNDLRILETLHGVQSVVPKEITDEHFGPDEYEELSCLHVNRLAREELTRRSEAASH